MRSILLPGAAVALALAALAPATSLSSATATPSWAMNATVIEACSCPMFCQCYFNTEPAGHAGAGHEGHGGAKHFCRANNAYRINKGHYGATKLDGAKFWIAADLGADFADGEMDWAVVYFDKALTPEQRAGIGAMLPSLFPVKWKSLTTAEGVIDTWKYDNDTAVALLDGGKTAEVRLKRFAGMTSQPVVIKNLRYWGAPRNDGFVMMPNEVEAYRVGPNAFEFKGTNGFMLTLDMSSADAAPAAEKKTD
jgi:uncharacterized protein DUF1326